MSSDTQVRQSQPQIYIKIKTKNYKKNVERQVRTVRVSVTKLEYAETDLLF